MQMTKPLLLVEDDRLDAAIMKRCLRLLSIQQDLVHKTNGEEAMEYLRDCPDNRPCVILLDLNMPRMSGLEFLGHVKADDSLRNIPVLIVTTSAAAEDMEACFRLGAEEYIIKDYEFAKFVESMRSIERYCVYANDEPAVSADA
jgi:CheY-like chemotaxis protein